MNILIVTHEHRYGTSVYVMKTELERNELPDEITLSFILGMNFEEDKDEIINIDLHGPDFIPTLTEDYKLVMD